MASNFTIKPDELEETFSLILDDFKKEVDKKNEKAVRKVGKDTADELKQTSPKRSGSYQHYADGWKSRVEKDGLGSTISRVYNSTKPSLTHLLEFGHGGPAPAPAHEHIAPAYQKGKAQLEKEIKQ